MRVPDALVKREMDESDTDLNCSWCEDKHGQEEAREEEVEEEETTTTAQGEEEEEAHGGDLLGDKSTCTLDDDTRTSSEEGKGEVSTQATASPPLPASSDGCDEARSGANERQVIFTLPQREDGEEEESALQNETSSELYLRHNNKVSIIHLSFKRR